MTVYERLNPMLGYDITARDHTLTETAQRISSLRREAAAVKAELVAFHTQFSGFNTSHYEHERSSFLSQVREKLRAGLEIAGAKVTESGLDAMCRAAPEYVRWLEDKRAQRELMFQMEAKLARIDADIEEAKMEREAALLMIRRDEEIVRFLRAEMGIS